MIELLTKYPSDQFKEDEMGGACSMYGGEVQGTQVSVGKASGKIPLERMHVAFVFYVDLRNKQRLFPYTALTDWFL